jgi:hypothetical protein
VTNVNRIVTAFQLVIAFGVSAITASVIGKCLATERRPAARTTASAK